MIEVILNEYKEILQDLDLKAKQTQKGLPMIPCPNQCYDCCKQIFPMSFLEAYYISKGFHSLERKERRELEKIAKKALKRIEEINAKEFTHYNMDWKDTMAKRASFSDFLNKQSSNCPFLKETKDGGKCTVYEYRNHDCRAHGYSYEKETSEIIACFRFIDLFPDPTEFIDKAFEYNYRYTDKLKLDRKLIVSLTQNPKFKNVLYLTHPFVPMLKNFEETDWAEWFQNNISENLEIDKYSLIIDCDIT